MCEEDKKWAIENLSDYGNFEDFVNCWINKFNIFKYIHFIPQYEFLCIPYGNRMPVDFIGRFENIEIDFQNIKNKLYLDPAITLKKENVTSLYKLDYRNFYTDKMRNIVSSVYKKDIKLYTAIFAKYRFSFKTIVFSFFKNFTLFSSE